MKNGDLLLLNATTLEGLPIDLAVSAGRIVEIAPTGRLRHPRSRATQVLEVKRRLLTPGLWDAHLHLYHWSLTRDQLSLADCGSREDLLARLEQAPTGDGWLLGYGWSSGGWPERRPPSRQELDRRTGHRPALLWCADLHSVLANTAALEKAGLLAPDLRIEGGEIERAADGSPTGWLKEMAANRARRAVPEATREQLKELLESAALELLSYGITGVCDQRIKEQNDGPAVLAALLELEQQERWPLRTSVNVAAHHLEEAVALGLRTGFGSDRVRLGHLKLFADGTLGSRTARMLEPFADCSSGADGRGVYLTEPEEMRQTIARAARTGWSVSVHAIGDEANRVSLDLFEELDRQGVPRPQIPHRIEHAQFLDDREVARFAPLNLTASVQAGHLLDDRAAIELALGKRSRLAYRFADLERAGARLVFGTDAPVSRVDPQYGFQAALHRQRGTEQCWFADQCLSPATVWQGYTANAAHASGWHDLVGRIAEGMRADLVVWDNDPAKPWEGGLAQASHTISDGQIVFSRTP